MHFLMLYEFGPDYLEKRGPFRGEHLRLAWESQARGEMILGGAFADPADGAALLFRCETSETPLRFAANDPYVKAGVVKAWHVRKWTTVVGTDATTPVRPEGL